jgi:hypothetical protein
VDDAIGSYDIGGDHLRFVDHHGAISYLDFECAALECFGFSCLHSSGHDFGWHYGIFEDCLKLGLVFRLEQRLDSSCGELFKCLIGRGKDGERAISIKCFNEAGCLHCCHESGEVFVSCCDSYQGFLLRLPLFLGLLSITNPNFFRLSILAANRIQLNG